MNSSGLQWLITGIIEQVEESTHRGTDGWIAIERVVKELVDPAVKAHGADAVIEALAHERENPIVAAVLVEVIWNASTSHTAGYRVTDLFAEREIVKAVLNYLENPEGGINSGAWAWTLLWNLLGQLDVDTQMRLVREVIESVPWDDRQLWMLGDGPLSELVADAERETIIHSWPTTKAKIERIYQLHGGDSLPST